MINIDNMQLILFDKLKSDVRIKFRKVTPLVTNRDQLVGGVLNLHLKDGYLFGDVAVIDEELFATCKISGIF